MELLDKLNTLFRHYDNAEFPLPMVDTFDRSDQDYRYITIAAPSFISEYAKKDAEKWATQIHDNPEEFLESRISRLKDYFAYADKCEREARKQDDSTDMAYRSLAYCFYECAVFHAAVLYRECYKQKMICADIFFIPGAELSDIFRQIGLWDFQESRQYLCQHCSKDCNHRCSQPLETITQTTKNGSLNNRETPPINTDRLLDCFPGIKVFFDRLVRTGYLNEDYSTTTAMNDTFASIVAHEIALELNFKALYSPFEKFWGIKDIKCKIWNAMMPELPEADAHYLAEKFDFSGGQIENVVRKKTIQTILTGQEPEMEALLTFCCEEMIGARNQQRKIGF